jgi:hypothetical protein
MFDCSEIYSTINPLRKNQIKTVLLVVYTRVGQQRPKATPEEAQWSIFAQLAPSASTITYPIWKDRSLLFANEASVKQSRRSDSLSSLTKRNPLAAFCICH